MASGPIDLSLPADNAPIVVAELRDHLTGFPSQINTHGNQLNNIFGHPSAIGVVES